VRKKKESKMERKFNVGDKVRVITNGNPCPKGTIGKVLDVDSLGAMLGFEEHFPRMHDGKGRVKRGHGWYFLTHELELVESEVEKNPTFKIGDRVKAIAPEDSDRIVGKTGTICSLPKRRSERYGVRFDDYIKGHDCHCDCEDGYGWYVPGGKLVRLINEDKSLSKDWKVVIIPEGDKTLGRLYENGKVIKSVETTKHPDDKYSVEEATKVIMERLFPEKEEVKPVEPKEPPFRVGDVIEMLEDYYSVPKGARGLVVGIDFDTDLVIDFKMKYADTHRCRSYFSKIGEAQLSEPTGLYVRPNRVKKVD
jgi:hypothetical protein